MAKQAAGQSSDVKTSNNRPSDTMSMEQALAALIQRNEELTSLNRSKDEFIAITSHQLRTPATGVKQYLGLLLEGYAEPLTDSQRIFLEKAYENNERQLHIVDDILRVAQLDLDKIRLELAFTDIRETVQEAVSALQGKFHLRNQRVKVAVPEEPVLIKVDPEQFRMAIENLLENASNYSGDGKTISARVSKLKKGIVRLAIKDQGVGIKPADFPKLFQKFSRINNPLSDNVSGTGLGLYYCKKVIELLGGTIKVQSKIEKGTIFIIDFPVQK